MLNKIALKFILCFTIIFAALASAFGQTQNSFDIPSLLREVKQKSDDNWRKVIAELPNYSYKWRKVLRQAGKKRQIKETSELYEIFFPTKCPIKKCRIVTVLLAENGKPLTAAKIEKQRVKAGERLERMEEDVQAQQLPVNQTSPLRWMEFPYYISRLFSSKIEIIVSIDAREILEKCEFFTPVREIVNGRETIALSFRPRADAVFSETTSYIPQAEGKIWIDATEKVLIRLAIWQKETKFAETTSDYLLEHAALARDLTRTEEGIWFPRLGRINGLGYPNLFAEMKSDFSIEDFDYHRFNTEIKSVQVGSPIE